MTDFRKKLKDGELLVGTLITLTAPEVSEIMLDLGFDWLFIDTEHSPYGVQSALAILQATGTQFPCVIRVPSNEDVWIKKALDIGPAGIIVPQVNTPEVAQRVVSSCKYAPAGSRGVGIGRAHRYGLRFQEYVEAANEDIAVIVQAEHIEAVKNIESIVKVPGVDAILIGPYDLSASMGKMGQVTDPEVLEAMERVRKATLGAGLRLGIFGVDAAAVKPFIPKGFTLITVGTDVIFLAKAAREALTALKP